MVDDTQYEPCERRSPGRARKTGNRPSEGCNSQHIQHQRAYSATKRSLDPPFCGGRLLHRMAAGPGLSVAGGWRRTRAEHAGRRMNARAELTDKIFPERRSGEGGPRGSGSFALFGLPGRASRSPTETRFCALDEASFITGGESQSGRGYSRGPEQSVRCHRAS